MNHTHSRNRVRLVFFALVFAGVLFSVLVPAFVTTTVAQGPTPSKTSVPKKVSAPTVYDDFNDNTVDSAKWNSYLTGSGPTFAETNQRLEISIPASSSGSSSGMLFLAGLTSTCGLSGDFDIQVSFQLLNWPAKSGVRVGLSPGWAVERVSLSDKENPPTTLREVYVMHGWDGLTATSDQSGKLRLVRSGNTMTGYYYAGSWIPVASKAQTTGPVSFFIAAWSHNWAFIGQDAKIAFDDVIVNQGNLDCSCDLTVTGMEATQGIQNLNNSVTLVKDKETLVRVFVQAKPPQDNSSCDVSNVTAQLSGGAGGPLNPDNGSTITAISQPATNRPDSAEREQLRRSLNFTLPKGWINSTGVWNLTARVNPNCTSPELDCSNNTMTVPVTFAEEPPLQLYLYHLVWRWDVGDGEHRVQSKYRDRIVAKIAAMYPVPSVDVHFREIHTSTFSDQPGFWSHVAAVELLAPALSLDEPEPQGAAIGLGYMPGAVDGYTSMVYPVASIGMKEREYGVWTAVHELGHIFGRSHAPRPPDNPACVKATLPGSYPYPDGRLSLTLEPYLGTTFYAYDPTALSPNQTMIYRPGDYDIMNYCTRQWMSDYTWDKVRAKHPLATVSGVARPDPGPGEYLYASGVISLTTNTAQLMPFYRLVSTTGKPLATPGDYALRLLAGNTLLASYPFTVPTPLDVPEGAEPFTTFGMWVPYITGTTRIELTRTSQILASRQVSSNAPTVSFTSPQAGARVNAQMPVAWNASDADGDSLTFWVFYSQDDGTSWQTVAIGLTTNTFELDTTHVPGSNQARLKVIATDGVNTTEAISAQFQVSRNGPAPTIIVPEDNGVYAIGEAVRLQGAAWDEEDGYLPDAALSWVDGISGALGTGKVLNVSSLAQGWHTITLTARDSDNMTGTATVTVFIGSPFYLYLPLIER
jgi:hypothetical protein